MMSLKDRSFNTGRGGGGRDEDNYGDFWTKEWMLNFSQILKGGLNFLLRSSLANIFNKCHKKTVFNKNN